MDFTLHFQPLTRVHLGSNNLRGHENGATMAYVYAFSGIAVFMLLIACINYMNLATARSLKRAKEVGIRKTVGSSRRQLMGQYLLESTLVALLATVISLTLVQLSIPLFNHITAKRLSLMHFLDVQAVATLVAIALFTGLVSGSYPALVLSGYKPVQVLKGGIKSVPQGLWIRRSLVVFQFAVSVLMIVGTLVVYQQLKYMKNNHPGFIGEQVLTVKLQGETLAGKAATFKDRLLGQAGVTGVSFATDAIGEKRISSTQFIFRSKGEEQRVQCENMEVDYDYLSVLNIALKEGRNFSRDISTDGESVLINEALAHRLGVASPLGLEIEIFERKYRIIGVVKDFHLNSLHNTIEPLLLRLTPESGGHVYVKVPTKDIGAARSVIAREYARLRSPYPLEIGFLDQVFARQYEEDERKSDLFLAFASVTIFIACLGLFGLAAFSMEQRTKEIGVRKVLGASVPELVRLLSRDFLVLVLAANLAAWPLAWFGLQGWLSRFPYRTDVTAWVFVGTGILTIGIALFTVGFQTLRAARANPVGSLRSE
jgi:putative ABC transport system permease protein